ncbi:hypothetical protein ONJ87_25535, partial [Salmonella enterica subsp. enterica serovar Anatum]|nr:hypothetical protein [Salmonella enterica subsp. enterica serovar Anatum]
SMTYYFAGMDALLSEAFTLFTENMSRQYQDFFAQVTDAEGACLHSGGEIHLGLGNANKLLARFLAGHAEELDLRLIDFNGGTLRN